MWGLGFGVQGLGLRVWDLGLGVARAQGLRKTLRCMNYLWGFGV